MSTYELFLSVWALLPKIDFDLKWHNGRGYLNGAAKHDVEHHVSFTDDYGRKGIILRNGIKQVVIFEHYSSGDGALAINTNKAFDLMCEDKYGSCIHYDSYRINDTRFLKDLLDEFHLNELCEVLTND